MGEDEKGTVLFQKHQVKHIFEYLQILSGKGCEMKGKVTTLGTVAVNVDMFYFIYRADQLTSIVQGRHVFL